MGINESEFAVHLTSPKGKPFVLLPGDEIPSWAAKQITNPYVLGVDPDAEDDDSDDDEDSDLPPESGPGSGIKAWRQAAEDRGIEVTDLDKPALIAACKAHDAEDDDSDDDEDSENTDE